MIGLELDCPTLEALGDAAHTDQPVWCRVRACGEVATQGAHCEDHDTPEVRAMSRPHQYVFNGRRIVLESQPWDELPAEAADQQMAVITTITPIAPATPPRPSPRAIGRPCWAWCGRPGPAPHCHLASRYGRAPTFPCLLCGREIHRCQGDVLLCRDDCAEFVRDLRSLGPAQTSAAWFTGDEREAWEERAAMLQDSGMHRAAAERRAVLIVWRASRENRGAPVPPSSLPAPLVAPPAPPPAPPAAREQLELFTAAGQ
jgi:hypothetical protein